MKLYGNPPEDLGLIDLNPTEMLCWVYCPIKVPGGKVVIPLNLRQFEDVIRAVRLHDHSWNKSYVYVTAKTLWVSPHSPGNRPGWHSDGFMTNDLNYIWSTNNPTEFWTPDKLVPFTQDHAKSLDEMDWEAGNGPIKTYPDKHLLRLDETVIHRVNVREAGYRTFVKVSVSDKRYNLIGNSINHELDVSWEMKPRQAERNHPSV